MIKMISKLRFRLHNTGSSYTIRRRLATALFLLSFSCSVGRKPRSSINQLKWNQSIGGRALGYARARARSRNSIVSILMRHTECDIVNQRARLRRLTQRQPSPAKNLSQLLVTRLVCSSNLSWRCTHVRDFKVKKRRNKQKAQRQSINLFEIPTVSLID